VKLTTLEKLLEDQLKDLYSAENQVLKALPKMAKAASTEELRDAFLTHREETEGQIERLDRVGKLLGIKLTGKKCKAAEGLIEEGKEILEADGPAAILDAALIMAAQRFEHYEISAYGSARTLAEHLGYADAAEILQETLDEESATDEKLTAISVEAVLPLAEGGEDEEEEEVAKPARRLGRAAARR
jgi:ferritin-like metal-binding protein YciE